MKKATDVYYYMDSVNNNLFAYFPEYNRYFDNKEKKIVKDIESEDDFLEINKDAQPIFATTFFSLLDRWFMQKYPYWNELLEQEIIWD